MMTPKKTGPKMVTMMNHLVRTRSRNSRLMTVQSLAMTGHSLLDARRPDLLEEDLVEGRLDQFEALHGGTDGTEALQQHLRVAPGCHLDLEETVGVVHARHLRVIGEDRRDGGRCLAAQ